MSIIAISVPQKKFNILSPIGGFGNHIRWLILLDPDFQFYVKCDEQSYNNLQGPSWPSYNDYKLSNWSSTNIDIKKEISELCRDYECVDTDSKLAFIQDQVYHHTRTWSNWLDVEWKYRNDLDSIIDFKHDYTELSNDQLPTLISTIDPELAYTAYLKFNRNINVCPANVFKLHHVSNVVKKNLSAQLKQSLVVDAGVMFTPCLDFKFYADLTEWLGLSNQYAVANFVHNLWYQAHKRAELEFNEHTSSINK